MKQILLLSCLVFVLGSSYCDRRSTGQQNSVLGQYELSAHDNSGRLVFTGTISLTSLEQNHLKGQCVFLRQKNAPENLQDESGVCGGEMDGKKISIDSAPFLDDAGLILEGQFDNGRITGKWRIDGFVTSGPLGNFDAMRKK